MNKTVLKIVFISLITLTFSACGGSDNDKSTENNNSSDTFSVSGKATN